MFQNEVIHVSLASNGRERLSIIRWHACVMHTQSHWYSLSCINRLLTFTLIFIRIYSIVNHVYNNILLSLQDGITQYPQSHYLPTGGFIAESVGTGPVAPGGGVFGRWCSPGTTEKVVFLNIISKFLIAITLFILIFLCIHAN